MDIIDIIIDIIEGTIVDICHTESIGGYRWKGIIEPLTTHFTYHLKVYRLQTKLLVDYTQNT